MNRYATCLALALPGCLSCAQAQDSTLEDEATAGAYPVVLTPARLRQSAADVPAAITVITAETMKAFAIRSLIDALRLVPGMEITHATGNDYRVNYHGTNILVPRRMNVLVDGVSIYRPGLARVDWKEVPVAIDDIERIEVTRGTDSAAYGPNSMLAVINIITKHPADVPRFAARLTAGSLGTVNATVSAAGRIGESQIRASLNTEHDTGYDALSRVAAPHDSTSLTRLYLRSVTPLSEGGTLDVTAGAVAGTKEVPFVETFQTSFPDENIQDYYAGLTWRLAPSATHEMQLRANFASDTVNQDWNTCIPTALLLPEMFDLWAANPAFARAVASGQVPTRGSARDNALVARAIRAIRALGAGATRRACATTANQNLKQQRTDLELQDTYVFSPGFRLVAGIGARHDRGDSQTFLGGVVTSTAHRVFANAEYKPIERLRLNLGGYLERDQFSGTTFSPRVAVNVDLAPNQTVRAIVSTGTRAPDLFEQRANWSYSADDFNPPVRGSTSARFFQSARSPGNVKPERIVNRELGYLVSVRSLGLVADLKVFNDSLYDLISEKLQVSDFNPTNGNRVTLRGAELQASMAPSRDWRLFLNYAYLENRDATLETERTQYSRHSGSLGVARSYPGGWQCSAAHYAASGDGLGESGYGRTDLHIARTLPVGASKLTLALTLSYLGKRSITYFRDTNDFLRSTYNNPLQAFGTVALSF